jgi:hypothetical protein
MDTKELSKLIGEACSTQTAPELGPQLPLAQKRTLSQVISTTTEESRLKRARLAKENLKTYSRRSLRASVHNMQIVSTGAEKLNVSTSSLTHILGCYPVASTIARYITQRDVARLAFSCKAVYYVLDSQGLKTLMRLSLGCSVNCTQTMRDSDLQKIARSFHKCFFCSRTVCVS